MPFRNPPDYHGRLRVLVVEDEADQAAATAALLRLEGHDANVARDGQEALDAVGSRPFDVVLLDIGLPRMGGTEVAERLRGLGLRLPPFLVAVTGYAQEEDARRCREAGVDLHLPKPVDPDRLLSLLRSFAAVVRD